MHTSRPPARVSRMSTMRSNSSSSAGHAWRHSGEGQASHTDDEESADDEEDEEEEDSHTSETDKETDEEGTVTNETVDKQHRDSRRTGRKRSRYNSMRSANGSSHTSKNSRNDIRDNSSHRYSRGEYIAPLHRWRRTTRCTSPVSYQWRRVDDMLHDAAQRRVSTTTRLTAKRSDTTEAEEEANEKEKTTDIWALSSMFKPSEWAIRFDPQSHVGSAGAFVSFTREEFDEAMADGTACEPVGAGWERSGGVGYDDASRLFQLYERFGNFDLVADRWSTCAPTTTTMSPCEVSEARAQPSAQALCAEYTRVTRALLRRRMRRLQQLLLQPDTAHDGVNKEYTECEREEQEVAHGEYTKASTQSELCASASVASSPSSRVDVHSTRTRTNTPVGATVAPPLLTLLRKHPLFVEDDIMLGMSATQQQQQSQPTEEDHEMDNNNNNAPIIAENVAAVPTREEEREDSVGRRGGRGAKSRRHTRGEKGCRAMSVYDTCVAALTWQDTPQTAWQSHASSERRRCVLHTLLEQERIAQVQFNRAAASYSALCARALPLLQRAQPILHNRTTDTNSAADGIERGSEPNNSSSTTNTNKEDGNDGEDNSNTNSIDALCENLWQPFPWSPGCVRQRCPFSSASTSTSASTTSAAGGVSESASSGAGSGFYTREALEYEMNVVIPLHLTRLAGAVRAGWLLPPPSATPTSSNPGIQSTSATGRTTEDVSHATKAASSAAAAHSSSSPDASSSADAALLAKQMQYVHSTGVCNRAVTHMSESVLLTLPRAVPLLYREVEQELEKYLLDDPWALMEDTGEASLWTEEIRVTYTQNLLLSRQLHKMHTLKDGLEKLIADVRQATASFADFEEGEEEEDGQEDTPSASREQSTCE